VRFRREERREWTRWWRCGGNKLATITALFRAQPEQLIGTPTRRLAVDALGRGNGSLTEDVAGDPEVRPHHRFQPYARTWTKFMTSNHVLQTILSYGVMKLLGAREIASLTVAGGSRFVFHRDPAIRILFVSAKLALRDRSERALALATSTMPSSGTGMIRLCGRTIL
jgi:hypothetical protein